MPIPRFDVEFTRDGRVFDSRQIDRLLGGLADATDLIVISHGWNNNMQEARDLYDAFLVNVEKVRALGDPDSRRFAACQVFWPSKKFTDEQLIPGGGAVSATAANDASLEAVLDALARDPERLPADAAAARASDGTTPAVRRVLVDQAKELARHLETEENREKFVRQLRTLLDPSHASDDDASADFFTADPKQLFRELEKAVVAPTAAGGGGAAAVNASDGSAAGLKDMLDGAAAAARRLANYATYYQMKARAGDVGSLGLGPVLRQVRSRRHDIKLHLVGHSFGGRVVTAAAHALDPQTPNVTMTLLQAAFSHNGLAERFEGNKNGFFRSLVADRRASGPIIITHTKNDTAVGIAYPLASRIANQKAAAFGDENDPYGGMGRNGAQHTPEARDHAQDLRPVGHEYEFQPGRIYNLKADRFITNHGDITGPQVVAAFLAAATAI